VSNQDLEWLAAQQPRRIKADPGARERARQTLVEHATPRAGGVPLSIGGRVRARMVGFGAAAGITAVAAALVVMASDNPHSSGVPKPDQSTRAPSTAVVSHHHSVRSPLVRLADYVSDSGTPAGDATLVARTTGTGSGSVTVYDLYADNGQYFFSPTEAGLSAEVSAHHNLAGGLFAREVAAAKLAATGNVQTAAQDMADAPDPSKVVSPTQTTDAADLAAKQAATGQPQVGNLFDNWAWENSQDALVAGSGDPEVRAGVLRILATLPGVTVTQGSSGGQSTLVLTAGSAEVGYDRTEQMTINAETGVPIQFVGGQPGGLTGTVTYGVSRVTLANMSSGTGNAS
jgi:hypothetical protein